MKPGDVVEAEWLDHAQHSGQYDGQGLSHQRSIGYVVVDDERTLRLAQSMTTDDGSPTRPSDVLVIDKAMLLRKRKVR